MPTHINPYQDDFPDRLREYVAEIQEAIRGKKHHDHRRHLFIEFLRKGFGVEPSEIELEKKLKVAQVRGRIDALFKNVIFEFKSDLEAELPAARVELKKYFKSRPRPRDYVALVTDGLKFVVFQYEKDAPRDIARFTIESGDELSAFRLLDQFIFASKQIAPRSADITNRFGLHSAVFNSCLGLLKDIYVEVSKVPSVRVKFREWNALLSRVYGSAIGDPALFLKHTYLTMLSRLLVARALAPSTQRRSRDYAGLLTGEFFKARNLSNLAEPDFFSWAVDTPQEKDFVGFLAKLEMYLGIYDLSDISEDILKEVYQELVDPESRHALGEYYTPDWLADLTLETIRYEQGRILDPACGSGSFLLAAIRRKRAQGLKGKPLLDFALESVIGIDVHPLAVLMAKANIILAMVREIQSVKRDVYLPVYMADTLLVSEDSKGERIVVRVSEDEEFNIPLETIRRQSELDPLVDKITDIARLAARDAKGSESAIRKLRGGELADMSTGEQFFWLQNFKLMTKLIGTGRDTIYGYILKNAYRPAYVRQNKVDYIVGNPPWLSYRYVRDLGYKTRIKDLTFDLKLLNPKEVKLFTHMDTSTLFLLYCTREFLAPGGTAAFVLPKSTILAAKQHAGFQSQGVSEIHDFTDVSPLFNVRSVLVIRRLGSLRTSNIPLWLYKASLPAKNMTWESARRFFETAPGDFSFLAMEVKSKHYYARFFQGASLVPRCFWFVQRPQGAAENIKAPHLETSDDAYEAAKEEWKLRLQGRVEREFLFETVLAKGLFPFHVNQRELVFLPVRMSKSGPVVADLSSLLEAGASHAADWMQKAEAMWGKSRSGAARSLRERLNYNQTMTQQNVDANLIVLYNTSGTNLTAALVERNKMHSSGQRVTGFFAGHVTYYYYPDSKQEGEYLCAFLNADVVNELIKVFQPQGLYGERHICRLPFEVCAIPKFDAHDPRHAQLARLARECSKTIAKHSPSLTGTLGRRRVGAKVLIKDEMDQINKLVNEILKEAGQTAAQPARGRRTNPNFLLFDIL